jgi:hypothetical protein
MIKRLHLLVVTMLALVSACAGNHVSAEGLPPGSPLNGKSGPELGEQSVRLNEVGGGWIEVTVGSDSSLASVRKCSPSGLNIWVEELADPRFRHDRPDSATASGVFYNPDGGGADAAAIAAGAGIVFVVLYSRFAPGADIYAFDAGNGRFRWSAPIRAYSCPTRSRYQNDIAAGTAGDLLFVRGVESMGRYELVIGSDGVVRRCSKASKR